MVPKTSFHRSLLLSGFIPPFLICCLPFLVNIPSLSGWLNTDPIYVFSMLTTDYAPAITPGFAGWNDPNAGWHAEALGRLAARQWLNGEIPWWNPFTAAGVPLAAEMQSSALFLPFILLLNLNHGIILLKIAMQIVAGFATFALLRQLELRRISATTGALLYEFSGCIAWTAHAPLLPMPFVPLFLLGIEYARAASLTADRAPRMIPSGWATIAVAISFSLYAGFPETAYLNGLLVLIWATFRLLLHPAGARIGFAWRIAAGGVVGLLLTSPLLWSFTEYLLQSQLGDRLHVPINEAGQYAPGLALYFFPYLFGQIAAFSGYDPSATLGWIWSRSGGYVGLIIFLAAVSALFGGTRERGLRWLLAVWILVALAETAAVPGLVQLFRWIPLSDFVMVSRYAVSSWVLAAIILASLAIDDRLRKDYPRFSMQLIAIGLCVGTAIAALIAAWPLVTLLLHNVPHFRFYPVIAISWGAVTFAIAAYLLLQRSQRGPLWLSGLAVVDAMILFAVPQMSGLRNPKLNLPAVRFLQENLGLQRFYTLGPFAPNYGAYFGVASINSDYQPVPAIWAEHIRHKLDSKSDVLMFMGNFPPGISLHARELRDNIASYRELGVKYVVTSAAQNPFLVTVEAAVEAAGARPLILGPEKSIQGAISGATLAPGDVDAFGVEIGTYAGASTGNLAVELCNATACAKGEKGLDNAADNKTLIIPLDRALSIQPNDTLRYTITHSAGKDVAIWLKRKSDPASQPSANVGVESAFSPNWLLRYRTAAPEPLVVYADPSLTIFELTNPAPYFETRGAACQQTAAGRLDISVSCAGPAVLVRREMSFPGWRATVNGRQVTLGTTAPFFQTVELPAGPSRVKFAYSPPGIGWTYIAFGIGMLGLLATNVARWPVRRPIGKRSLPIH
jgi:hypothetical protein